MKRPRLTTVEWDYGTFRLEMKIEKWEFVKVKNQNVKVKRIIKGLKVISYKNIKNISIAVFSGDLKPLYKRKYSLKSDYRVKLTLNHIYSYVSDR